MSFSDITDTYSHYSLYGVWFIVKTVLNVLGWFVAAFVASGFEDHVNYMIASNEATTEEILAADKVRCEEDYKLVGTKRCQEIKKIVQEDADLIEAERIVAEEEEFGGKGSKNDDGHFDSGEEDLFEPEVAEEGTIEADGEEPTIFKVLQ